MARSEDSARSAASPEAPKEPTQPVVKDAPQAPSAPAAAQAEVEQDAASAQGVKGPITDPADPVEGAVEEVIFVLTEDDDAPEDLRVAFPGSHDVEGADDDGFVTLPVQLNAAQAYAASTSAFTHIEERR